MKNRKRIGIGVMSGTSLDGIDVAAVYIDGVFEDTVIEVIGHETISYNPSIYERIIQISNDVPFQASSLSKFNVELGKAYADAVYQLCLKHHILPHEVNYIALHGQTVFHDSTLENGNIPSTWQMGDASVVAEVFQTTVVSNFRVADVAAGGLGAPLVPYVDYVMFRSKVKSRAIHNIGGISNLTFLPANGSLDEVIAFDSGPGNMMINHACKLLYGLSFDEDGKIARSGTIIPSLLKELMNHPYLSKKPPKSTGREAFGEILTGQLIKKYHSEKHEDLVSTFTYFTALSIVNAYEQFIINDYNLDEIYLCGGGAKNRFLVSLLAEKLPNILLQDIETLGIKAQAKEAIAFAVLGNETIHQRSANIPSVTGTKRKVVLGQVQYGKPIERGKT